MWYYAHRPPGQGLSYMIWMVSTTRKIGRPPTDTRGQSHRMAVEAGKLGEGRNRTVRLF